MASTLIAPADTLSDDAITAFAPTGERARFLDQRMRRDLASSLRYILQQANGQLKIDLPPLEAFLDRVEKAPVSPLAFSYYCDAVIAIEEDDLDEAAQLLSEMSHIQAHPGGPQLVDLANPKDDAMANRFIRFIDTDPSITFEVFPPPRDVSDNCRSIIHKAFALMDAGDPEQAAELRALLREIVLGAGSLDPNVMTFDGASSFMLWGAILINANQRDSELAMAQMLVHEGSHNLLFGMCADEPLVENADDELFKSPLRTDPRPMDGIYHATFVTARMYRVVRKLYDSGILSPTQQEFARKELDHNARLFNMGLGTVREHGRLTSLGKTVMKGAADYMASYA